MIRLFSVMALALAVLAGCGPKAEEDQFVRNFFEHVRTDQLEAAQSVFADNLKTADTLTQLQSVRAQYIPVEPPTKSARINWSFNSVFGGASRATYVYRYDYSDRVLIVTTNVVTEAEGSPPRVEGFHVNVTPLTAEVAAAAEFSLANKPLRQIAFLIALACSDVLMIIAFLGVIFTKGFKRKWMFAIVALAGAPVFVMNWSTGEWATLFSAGLINAGVTRGFAPLDPWMLKFHIPIGALIVLSLLLPHWTGAGGTKQTADT